MKIEVITTYYREEFLAPLFMLHYEGWADKITFLTNKFAYGKFNDDIKSEWINDAISKSDADWVVVVDMDEFVFPLPLGSCPRAALSFETGNIINCAMFRAWTHSTDIPINRMTPPLLQRLHGERDHVKPCIFKPKGVTLGIGIHSANHPGAVWGKEWSGAHWANADLNNWIERGIEHRGQRLSQNNLDKGQGLHTLKNRDQILAEYNSHLNDPAVINL